MVLNTLSLNGYINFTLLLKYSLILNKFDIVLVYINIKELIRL
jgi:hypothetical protein